MRHYMGIDLRGGDGAVSEQGLDVPNVHSCFQKRGCKGMAEHMRCHMAVCLYHANIFFDDPSNGLRGELPPSSVDQHDAFALDLLCIRSNVPRHEPQQLRRCDLDHPLLPSFPVDEQPQLIIAQLDRIFCQRAQLGHPQTCAEQKLQHHDVP